MDYLREGIHLRGMAQKDPLVEYRNEGHSMFVEHNAAIREEVVTLLFHAEVTAEAGPEQLEQPAGNGDGPLSYEHSSLAGADAILAAGGTSAVATAAVAGGGGVATPVAQRPIVKSELESIGRNDPCWCGSGKKYKKCHGA
jgi:preprotein translocase subunit SecA